MKKKGLKKPHVALAVVLLLVVAASIALASKDGGTGSTTSGLPAAVAFTVLDNGESAYSMPIRKNYRVTNADDLEFLWAVAYGEDGPPVPKVDFTKNDVLAVFAGEKPSGGYSIAVASVIDRGNAERAVTVRHIEPGSSCITASVITSPYELIVVPHSDAPIAREDVVSIVECE